MLAMLIQQAVGQVGGNFGGRRDVHKTRSRAHFSETSTSWGYAAAQIFARSDQDWAGATAYPIDHLTSCRFYGVSLVYSTFLV